MTNENIRFISVHSVGSNSTQSTEWWERDFPPPPPCPSMVTWACCLRSVAFSRCFKWMSKSPTVKSRRNSMQQGRYISSIRQNSNFDWNLFFPTVISSQQRESGSWENHAALVTRVLLRFWLFICKQDFNFRWFIFACVRVCGCGPEQLSQRRF